MPQVVSRYIFFLIYVSFSLRKETLNNFFFINAVKLFSLELNGPSMMSGAYPRVEYLRVASLG
jgi:hypothetical protein